MDASNPEQQALSSDKPMKITDLHDFCLMKIFEYLDFRSLFNVAVANRQLRPAANSICMSNFGIKTVHLGNNTSADFTPQNGKMTVNGLKMCLPFLRCFGSSIENLFIFHHNFNEKQCNYIHHHVNEYCAETLINMELWDKRNEKQLKFMGKPFVTVQTVEVVHTDLHNQLSSFAKWFPNVRSHCFVGTSFNHLSKLHIAVVIDDTDPARGITTTTVASLLQLCPQLQNLYIKNCASKALPLTTLLNIIQNKPDIYKLTLKQRGSTTVNLCNVEQIVNEHPLLVELDLCNEFEAKNVTILIQQLISLKKFNFFCTQSVHDRLVALLDEQWQVTIRSYWKDRCFVELRR